MNEPNSLEDVKKICREHGITDSVLYRQHYKNIPGLPAHPERIFKDEWISYKAFFDQIPFYSYDELLDIVRPRKLKSAADYKEFVSKSGDERLPYTPDSVFEAEWQDWFIFLGKTKPLTTKYITKDYRDWAVAADEFLEVTRAGKSKRPQLCQFIRIFIEKHDKSKSPIEFLIKENHNLKPLTTELEKLSRLKKQKIITTASEFIDSIIDEYFTLDDDDSSEVVRIAKVRNPLLLLKVNDRPDTSASMESTKACLQYHFVKKMQDWIIPSSAKSFRDLKHLQGYTADWFPVQKEFLDVQDPDCVYQKVGKNYFIWSPISWMQTYALTKVPLRGRQLAYNDSGEGDNYLADCDQDGRIIWVENTGKLRSTTKSQGFIRLLQDGEFGLYTTTNKTKTNQGGYVIPWLPMGLGYWMVKLRKWQQKYNSLEKPTSWSVCKRTNFNSAQRKMLGKNCFLFRELGGLEPQVVSSALVNRVAAVLYNIQPSDLELAELNGNEGTLTSYKSKYTPHSLRVSLITAYVVEFGMPIEMVMKIVGHSSIVMSIYYVKLNQDDIRTKLEQAEKQALKDKADAIQKHIEQGKIESLKNQLVSTNDDLLQSLTNNTPRGNFIFRDYGICPFAASRCDDGGEIVGNTQARAPVPNGYLGFQNCLRCRHFITGPSFLGGLQALSNEISFHANQQSEHYHGLQKELDAMEEIKVNLEREAYLASKTGDHFDHSQYDETERKLRKLESEAERSAKKLDMYLTDLQASYKLIHQSVACTSLIPEDSTQSSLALIKSDQAEMKIEMEEVSAFEQLQEICENAEIFQSASAEGAVAPRSQLLDQMAEFNGLGIRLYRYTLSEQLKLGNQVVALLKSRLGSMKQVDRLIHNEVLLSDLPALEELVSSEIELLIADSNQKG